MAKIADFGQVTIDSKNPQGLRDFYKALLGWDAAELFGCPALKNAGTGLTFLFVPEDEDVAYVPPVWPEEPGKQQKQMHFDLLVDDVEDAVRRAQDLGARKAKDQFGGEHFTVMFDPAGHPFCLCKK